MSRRLRARNKPGPVGSRSSASLMSATIVMAVSMAHKDRAAPGALAVWPARALRRCAGDVDDDTWARARGWALLFAVMFLASSADNEPFERLGRDALSAVMNDGG